MKPIVLSSRQICAVECVHNGRNVVIASVYMPCDKQSNHISDEKIEVINDLEYMLESDEHDEHLFMGDWNSDFNRNNTQSKELTNFLERNGLMAVPHSGTFTYQSHDLKNRSLIDHIFVLESGQYSHNCGPIQHLHHGCNLSLHIPLICNITVPDDSVRLPLSNDNPNRRESHAWYRVTNDDIYSYQNILNVSLHELHNNQNLFQCNDLNCRKTEHLKAITDYCVSLVDICIDADAETFPKCSPKKHLKPYWSEMIQPHKDCSLFWHSIWVENGKPRNGIIAQIMRQTRAKYHYFVRWATSNWATSRLRRSRMADNVTSGETRNFWTECKRMTRSSTVNRCAEIDGVSVDENIAELFANKYQEIYNSHHVNDSELQELRLVIESRLQAADSISISYIKSDEVTDAIKQLNSNKSDGNYGLYSNHLLLSSFHFREHLAKLFTCMLHHGHNPDYILEAVISSIPKNSKGDINSSDNYRGIALSSALGKVLDLIILSRYTSNLSSSDLRFAFKAKHSTVMFTSALKEIISHYTKRASNVYMCSLDATKAFDKVIL